MNYEEASDERKAARYDPSVMFQTSEGPSCVYTDLAVQSCFPRALEGFVFARECSCSVSRVRGKRCPPTHTHTYSRGAAAWSVALPGVGEHSFHQMLRAAPSLHGPPCIWVGPPQPGRHPGCPPWLVDEPGGGDAGFRGSCLGHKLQPWATSVLSPDPALSTCDHRVRARCCGGSTLWMQEMVGGPKGVHPWTVPS